MNIQRGCTQAGFIEADAIVNLSVLSSWCHHIIVSYDKQLLAEIYNKPLSYRVQLNLAFDNCTLDLSFKKCST